MAGNSNIILGIDPGTTVMGFGLVTSDSRRLQLLKMGVLKLAKYKDPYERLYHIHEQVRQLIALYRPAFFAIEAPFFGKNVQSMLKLGRAQGVAIAAAMEAGLAVTEYSPRKIKLSVTGHGNATKEQVGQMLQKILQFEEVPQYLDASDALAVAVCHYYQLQSPVPSAGSSSKGWKAFIAQNPEKIRHG